MQTTHYASCLGDCGQGDKPCQMPDKCFFAPAEAATDVGQDDTQEDERDCSPFAYGLMVSIGITAGALAGALMLAWAFGV